MTKSNIPSIFQHNDHLKTQYESMRYIMESSREMVKEAFALMWGMMKGCRSRA